MIRRLTCPICERELPLEVTGDSPLFPFCSQRCKMGDLYKWLNGEYAVVEELGVDRLLNELSEDDLPPE